MSKTVKILAGVVAALALGVAIVGGTALAQSGGEGNPPPTVQQAQGPEDGAPRLGALCTRFQEGVASELGVSVEAVQDAFKASALDMLDEAVEAGKVDPDKAVQLRERIEEGNGCWHPHPRASQPGVWLVKGLVVHAATETLDMTPRELVGELRACQSLTQVAETQGVERDDLKTGILSDAEKHLEQAAANGRITEERADEVLQKLTDSIDEIVDTVRCPAGETGA